MRSVYFIKYLRLHSFITLGDLELPFTGSSNNHTIYTLQNLILSLNTVNSQFTTIIRSYNSDYKSKVCK